MQNTSTDPWRTWEKVKKGTDALKPKPDIPEATMPVLDEAVFPPDFMLSAQLGAELENLVWEGTDWMWVAVRK